MGLYHSVRGTITIILTSADIPGALDALTKNGIRINNVRQIGDLDLSLQILRSDYRRIRKICKKRGNSLSVAHREGIYWPIKNSVNRPIFLLGAFLLVFIALYLPRRVFFLRVEGNHTIPSNYILETARDNGIRFGATRRDVRSEKVKNALLGAIPDLQWAGVNTYGCVAVITVRERNEPEEEAPFSSVSSIISSADGVVLSATATQGSLLCEPGQAVSAGQLLISGYTDCGLCIKATRAEGEIYARTKHHFSVASPTSYIFRTNSENETTRYALTLGKKRINLWKGSGISEGTCGRMYKEYYITLPGGFQLPIGLVRETVISYNTDIVAVSQEAVQQTMESFASDYMMEQMVAGEIDMQKFLLQEENAAWCLDAYFVCTEMIGRQRVEEIGDIHE